MDISNLIRDADKVRACLKKDNGGIRAIKPCKLYFPNWYVNTELCGIDDEVRVIGIFAIVVDDKYYSVSKADALIITEPFTTNIVEINGDSYMELVFTPGDMVLKNINLIRTGTLVYRIYNEIVAKGNVPWYFNLMDLCFVFDTAQLHGGVNLNTDSAILELIASCMARQKNDISKYYRHQTFGKADDVKNLKFISLNNVAHQASDTTSKLLGAYFNTGVTSALVTQNNHTESIETVLRQ